MKNVSDRVVEIIKIHIFIQFLSFLLWDSVEKYCRTRQTKDDDMAHAHCMLDT